MIRPPRQPRLVPSELDEAQLRLYRSVTEGPRSAGPQAFALTDEDGALVGPFGGFLLSPGVGEALQEVGAAVRYRTSLSPRARELAILAVAAHWDSAFEQVAHEAVGAAVGLTEEEMRGLREQELVGFNDEAERATLDLVRALLSGDVDDDTWQRCVPVLSLRVAYELIVLVGYYATLALQMRVLRID